MKNFNFKRVVLNPVFSSTSAKRKKECVTLDCYKDDNKSLNNPLLQLTALMLSLPIITALLLMWFNIK